MTNDKKLSQLTDFLFFLFWLQWMIHLDITPMDISLATPTGLDR
jgi:hypothetical protein